MTLGGSPPERLHVTIGPSCNNNCVFCIEENRAGRFAALRNRTDGDVRRMLQAGAGTREVMFTSGEPTLNPALPEYVRMARALGFARIGIVTNGRRFAYRPYARALLEAGLNHVLVSIHGPDAATHDALTRTRGSFEQTLAGLANLSALKDDFPDLKLHTATVVNRRNVGLLRQFLDAVRPFRIDQHVFNAMMAAGRGARHVRALMPRYSEIVARFRELLSGLPPEVARRVFLLDVPECVLAGLPAGSRGFVESYLAFEMRGTSPVAGCDSETLARVGGPEYRPQALDGNLAVYDQVSRAVHDALLREKRDECTRCAIGSACPGVFRAYVGRFGWDEFIPIPR